MPIDEKAVLQAIRAWAPHIKAEYQKRISICEQQRLPLYQYIGGCKVPRPMYLRM